MTIDFWMGFEKRAQFVQNVKKVRNILGGSHAGGELSRGIIRRATPTVANTETQIVKQISDPKVVGQIAPSTEAVAKAKEPGLHYKDIIKEHDAQKFSGGGELTYGYADTPTGTAIVSRGAGSPSVVSKERAAEKAQQIAQNRVGRATTFAQHTDPQIRRAMG